MPKEKHLQLQDTCKWPSSISLSLSLYRSLSLSLYLSFSLCRSLSLSVSLSLCLSLSLSLYTHTSRCYYVLKAPTYKHLLVYTLPICITGPALLFGADTPYPGAARYLQDMPRILKGTYSGSLFGITLNNPQPRASL